MSLDSEHSEYSQYSRLPEELRAAAQYRQELIEKAIVWIEETWQVHSPQDPRAWFAKHARDYETLVTLIQQEAAAAAIVAVDRALELQGYDQPTVLHANPAAFAGIDGEGRPVIGLVYAQVLKIAKLIDDDAPITERARMWEDAGTRLAEATQVAISDASRMAKFAQLEVRPHTTWIRVARTPCCDRCAILAGKRGSYRMDFQRHPGCDCDAIPISEETSDLHKQWVFDPQDYFDSLSIKKQNETFTKAGAQAIRDGADINQVVNALRGMSTAGESFSQRRWITTEGTTKRGLAAARLREQYDSFIRGQSIRRLTPHAIYQLAKGNRDVSKKLLIANGYLLDEPFYPPDTLPWVEKKLSKMQPKKPSKKQPKKPSKKLSKIAPTDPAELLEWFIKARKSCDASVPSDHIVVGEMKNKFISGAHSWERRQWVVEQLKQGARIPSSGKTFFPQLKGGDEALRAWLGDEKRGVVRDVLDSSNHIKGIQWGQTVYGIVETPDGHKIELALSLGRTENDDPRIFKINSVYPVRGQGVSEVLKDGTIQMKDFDGGEDGDALTFV